MAKKRKSNGSFKKTSQQAHQYNQQINSSKSSPDGTVPINSDMLSSSRDVYVPNVLEVNDKIQPAPFSLKVKDWIKRNLFASIISAALIAAVGVVVTHSIEIAVIDQKLNMINQQIEKIDSGSVDIETLNLQLENIKSKWEYSYSLDYKDIEWKIKELDEKIARLHDD